VKYILDTNILSEIVKPRPDFNTISWIQDHTDEVAITSVSLEELYYGIFLMSDGKKKEALKSSIDAIVKDCTNRTLAFDAFCGYLCA
jgi:predicted nucleic acid-binding protein